jgi:hypothetical protein
MRVSKVYKSKLFKNLYTIYLRLMTIINIFTIGAGFHVFMTYCFPNEYHAALLNLSFYVILFYTNIEMRAKKLYFHPSFKPVKSFIDKFNKNSEIDIIKFNQVMFSTTKQYILVHQLLLYDFIIFSDYDRVTETAPKVNKVLFFGLPKFPLNFDYKVCKFSFMSLTVKFNGTKYQIKLSSETENYYIVGNKINLLLISYLLKKQHNVNCDENTGIYELDVIDHNVNMKTFTEKDEIVFTEQDYTVSPFVYIDTSNMTVLDILNKASEDITFSKLNLNLDGEVVFSYDGPEEILNE